MRAADIGFGRRIKLLLNRRRGYSLDCPEKSTRADLKPEARRYLTNQSQGPDGDWGLAPHPMECTTARTDCGGAFRWLAPGAGLDAALVRRICQLRIQMSAKYELSRQMG